MKTCRFVRVDSDAATCVRCGRLVRSSSPAIVAECRAGLGDYIAAGLAWLGITKPRVEALVGGPCGCGERQEALNDWGRETLGIGRVDPPT